MEVVSHNFYSLVSYIRPPSLTHLFHPGLYSAVKQNLRYITIWQFHTLVLAIDLPVLKMKFNYLSALTSIVSICSTPLPPQIYNQIWQTVEGQRKSSHLKCGIMDEKHTKQWPYIIILFVSFQHIYLSPSNTFTTKS